MAKQEDLNRARAALDQIEWTAKRTLAAAKALRDDLTKAQLYGRVRGHGAVLWGTCGYGHGDPRHCGAGERGAA